MPAAPSDNADTDVGKLVKGVLLVIAATFAFALADMLIKYLAQTHPVPLVMAVRYGVNVIFLLVLLWPKHRSAIWHANRKWLSYGRGLCLFTASLCMGLGIRTVPLAEATAIVYLSPFAVILLSQIVLGERVGIAAWLGAIVGFSGVLLIARPGGGLDPVGVLFLFGNAAMATIYQLTTRFLTRTESTVSMTFTTALVGAVAFPILAIPDMASADIGLRDAGLMILLGISAAVGHLLFTAAYREAPASLLAPVNYAHLVWAGGFGWLVFSQLPDMVSIAGMIVIAVSGASITVYAHLKQKGKGLRLPRRIPD